MKINYKLIGLVMFVMLICCVSAASATDVDNITVPDDTDVIEIDDAVDSVDAVESDELSDDVVTSEDSKASSTQTRGTVTPTNYGTYFNTTTGFATTTQDLIFSGRFSALSFGNFKVNASVNIIASGARFTDIGFDLLNPNTNLTGGSFVGTVAANNGATINVVANNVKVNGVTINVNTPSGKDFYAINVLNSDYAKILNNVITYQTGFSNANNYNYVIKVKNSTGVKIVSNTITATLPLKTVVYWPNTGLERDYVAGVAVTDSNNFNFTKNNLTVTGKIRSGDYPTLDALIILNSANSYIEHNKIIEKDIVSVEGEYSYIYAIDVYECYNITINNNTVNVNGEAGGYISNNGTGAAYCIQLTGPHTGVIISNNTLTTKSNGPNLGIYSQNYYGETNLTICNNIINVSGKAGDNPWALVSGMELQDTYAKICNNTIWVNNTAGYTAGNCAYGISYVQTTSGSHYYDIENNNNITVYNGDYTIYLSSPATGIIQGNNLTAVGNSTQTGNGTIYAPGITPGSNP